MISVLAAFVASTSACTTTPCAIPLDPPAEIGLTTAAGTDARTGTPFAAGISIVGPFADGFSEAQSSELSALGCSPASSGFVPSGVDVYTAEQMIAHQCGVTLPRVDNEGTQSETYKALLDECGYDGEDGHFQEAMTCLYSIAEEGHSAKIGEVAHASGRAIYGKWEDQHAAEARYNLPALDACNGHFGVTPDSDGEVVYHYHTSGLPPFTLGCYGPDYDGDLEALVSPTKCRSLYASCGDDDTVTVTTTSRGTYDYDPWCPCFVRGKNHVPPPSPPPLPPLPPPSASPSSFSFDYHDFQYTMGIVALVSVDGAFYSSGTLVAFVGDAVRGITTSPSDPIPVGTYAGESPFHLVAYANSQRGETLSFKFERADGALLDLSTSTAVAFDETSPYDIFTPLILSASAGASSPPPSPLPSPPPSDSPAPPPPSLRPPCRLWSLASSTTAASTSGGMRVVGRRARARRRSSTTQWRAPRRWLQPPSSSLLLPSATSPLPSQQHGPLPLLLSREG